MSVVPLATAVDGAWRNGRAVPAFNVVDEVSMAAVLDTAEKLNQPVIVQVATRTVHFWGADVVLETFRAMVRRREVRATLHLDHCRDPALITACLEAGWNSALFDASHLPYEEAVVRTRRLVRVARGSGAHIEGEIHAIGSAGEPNRPMPEDELIATSAEFVRATEVTCFSPDAGTAHGLYRSEPVLRLNVLRELTRATGTPLVLHGGSGLGAGAVRSAVACGVAKVNFSAAIKAAYMAAVRAAPDGPPGEPLAFLEHVRTSVAEAVGNCVEIVRPQSGVR